MMMRRYDVDLSYTGIMLPAMAHSYCVGGYVGGHIPENIRLPLGRILSYVPIILFVVYIGWVVISLLTRLKGVGK